MFEIFRFPGKDLFRYGGMSVKKKFKKKKKSDAEKHHFFEMYARARRRGLPAHTFQRNQFPKRK